jgi:hypothetical protein
VQKAGWVGGIGNNLDKLAITLVSFIVLSTTTINPVILVILAAVLGLIVYR